jgi:hypothetical protein
MGAQGIRPEMLPAVLKRDVLIRRCFGLDGVDEVVQTVCSVRKERCHRMEFCLQRFYAFVALARTGFTQ